MGLPSFQELVLDQLAPQRVAVDAQPFGRARLVAVGVLHHHFEQRLLGDGDDHVVHGMRLLAPQVLEVGLQAVAYAFLDVLLAHAASSCGSSCPSAWSSLSCAWGRCSKREASSLK